MTRNLSDQQRINQLLHSASNCRQMLRAIDRSLATALECVYDGRIDECRATLEKLSSSLPQAIRIIEYEEGENPHAAPGASPGPRITPDG